jgi:hypothetical protein
MAARIEALKRGDAVLSKFPGDPIMTVLAVEGLKVRCVDGQNLQYWFDRSMLERYWDPRTHREVSPVAICESSGPDGFELSENPKQYYSHRETVEDATIADRLVEPPLNFWAYAEQMRRAPQTLAA